MKKWGVNPKAQRIHELYGVLDLITRDWTDGVFSKIFREVNEPLPAGRGNEIRWIVFDGDVDTFWVENLNSVMNDSRILTLPNGEHIRLLSHCSLICEVADLQYASPATVSRCGIVWVDRNLGYKPYYEKWIKSRFGGDDAVANHLHDCHVAEGSFLDKCFIKHIPPSVSYVMNQLGVDQNREKLVQLVKVSKIELFKQLRSMLDASSSYNRLPA